LVVLGVLLVWFLVVVGVGVFVGCGCWVLVVWFGVLVGVREDFIGVVERDATSLGQLQSSSYAIEQPVIHCGFKFFELNAHRGLRYHQLLAGTCNRTFSCNHPEIVQVVIVQPFHRPNSIDLESQSVTLWLGKQVWNFDNVPATGDADKSAPRALHIPVEAARYTLSAPGDLQSKHIRLNDTEIKFGANDDLPDIPEDEELPLATQRRTLSRLSPRWSEWSPCW
jgi:hypothetical protein